MSEPQPKSDSQSEARLKRVAGGALIAAAAGLASALLFVLASRGSLLTISLGYFAPLPIMVAAFSFGLWVGAAAALVGAAFVATAFHPILGLMFLLAIGGPAAVIAAAAILAPPASTNRKRDLAPNLALLAATLVAFVSISGGVAIMALRLGGFEALLAQAAKDAAPIVKDALGEAHASGAINAEDLTRYLVWAAPLAMAASEIGMMIFNLWLAGRVAIISGNLPRPWPSIADDLAAPPIFGALFAAACGLSFVGGLTGIVCGVAAVALGLAFAFQGLAVAHVLTRGSTMRLSLLFSMYALMLLLPPWPFCFLAVAGLADAVFHLRARKPAPNTKNV